MPKIISSSYASKRAVREKSVPPGMGFNSRAGTRSGTQ